MSVPTTLRLRPAVHVAPTPHGLLFRGWDGSVVVRGSDGLHRLWAALEPALARGVTTDELLARLPDRATGTVTKLVEQLADADLLLPATPATPLPAELRDRHADVLRYLDSIATDPGAAMLSFRAARVVLVADADANAASVAEVAARTLLGFGAERVWVSATLAATANVLGDARVQVTGDADAPRRWDVAIVVAAAPPAPGRVDAGTVIPVMTAGADVLVGPVTDASATAAHDAWARVAARADQETGDAIRSPLLQALAGNLAALEAFRVAAGLPLELEDAVSVIRAEGLTSSVHPVLPRRLGPTTAAPARASASDPVAFEEATEALCDDVTGPLPAPEPGSLPQAPLATARGDVPDGGQQVLAWGADGEEARRRALGEMVRRLAASEAPEAVAIGVARGVAGAIDDAAAQLATRRLAAGEPLVADGGREEVGPDRLDADGRRWWLHLGRDGQQLAVTAATGPEGLWGASVERDGSLVAVATGRDAAGAGTAALAHAVAREQLEPRWQLGLVEPARLALEADVEDPDRALARAVAVHGAALRHRVLHGEPALLLAGIVPVALEEVD